MMLYSHRMNYLSLIHIQSIAIAKHVKMEWITTSNQVQKWKQQQQQVLPLETKKIARQST